MFHCCKAGAERFLERELLLWGLSVQARGAGWVETSSPASVTTPCPDPCFRTLCLSDATRLSAPSVNGLAQSLCDYFAESARTERFIEPWPLLVAPVSELDEGLSRRASSVRNAWIDLTRRRMSRVVKLADPAPALHPGIHRGLFALLVDGATAQVSREAVAGGQRRMKDDPAAPSRSYLKVEEAYWIMGGGPTEGQAVCDLGAAPGGWSYSAARRGAFVLAIDNGKLAAGARNDPMIEPRCVDAFAFSPGTRDNFEWLFCDIVDDPYRVLELVRKWFTNRWCRSFIVNLKLGKTDPLAILEHVNGSPKGIAHLCTKIIVRQLYHDREEITLMGNL